MLQKHLLTTKVPALIFEVRPGRLGLSTASIRRDPPHLQVSRLPTGGPTVEDAAEVEGSDDSDQVSEDIPEVPNPDPLLPLPRAKGERPQHEPQRKEASAPALDVLALEEAAVHATCTTNGCDLPARSSGELRGFCCEPCKTQHERILACDNPVEGVCQIPGDAEPLNQRQRAKARKRRRDGSWPHDYDCTGHDHDVQKPVPRV